MSRTRGRTLLSWLRSGVKLLHARGGKSGKTRWGSAHNPDDPRGSVTPLDRLRLLSNRLKCRGPHKEARGSARYSGDRCPAPALLGARLPSCSGRVRGCTRIRGSKLCTYYLSTVKGTPEDAGEDERKETHTHTRGAGRPFTTVVKMRLLTV